MEPWEDHLEEEAYNHIHANGISKQAAVLLRGQKSARLSAPPGRQLLQQWKARSRLNAGTTQSLAGFWASWDWRPCVM